jgi:hypothetical protein
MLIFHQPWWLSAASGGKCTEITVRSDGEQVGRLCFVPHRRYGFDLLKMPPFTHVLGPAVERGAGKPETQLRRHLSIVRELVTQLPRFDFFHQVSPCTADILAFQDCGFKVFPQCNFKIDCRADISSIWDNMNFKTRGRIRRSEREFEAASLPTPEAFVSFYVENIKNDPGRDKSDLRTFPAVFTACRARESGSILVAWNSNGKPSAMIFVVWDDMNMYYLLSTRSMDSSSGGAVNLLVWTALKMAHERGLVFDFDGVINSGQMRFFLGFGGCPSNRFVITRSRMAYRLLRSLKEQHLESTETSRFIGW